MLIADRIVRPTTYPRVADMLLLLGALALAYEPAVWLVGTWFQQGYSGIGWFAFALVVGCTGWSISSIRIESRQQNTRTYWLLIATAILRLISQLLDVNVIGALLLGVDVYALASLAGLSFRRRAISPLALAILFCFCLPIEPMVQRIVGYDLQRISAWLACGMLAVVYNDLSCSGVRLQVDGHDVLVDLPCSGAELLSVLGLLTALLCTLRPLGFSGNVKMACAFLGVGLLVNGFRISVLALGIANSDLLPIDVMAAVPHTIIGMAAVLLACGVLVSLHKRCARLDISTYLKSEATHRQVPRLFAFLFLPFALLIGAIQPQPVDASPYVPPVEAPLVAAGFLGVGSALTDQEQRYFSFYGGSARRVAYGPFGLLLVSTASPLRHLHDPTICLTGMGYQVALLGTDHETAATVYRASRISQSGEQERYTVRVSYLSEGGELATSVAEVVWHWLRYPGTRWTMVQRIQPEHVDIAPGVAEAWEISIRRAFNLVTFNNQEIEHVFS